MADVLTSEGPGALGGLLIADFSRVLAGPYATMLLADLGADVVKVERPGQGDDTRSWGPPYAGETATYYLAANRNKRSIALDQATGFTAGGVVPRAMGNRHPSVVPYEVFQAADRPLVIAAGNDGLFGALWAALGLADDPRYATNSGRVAHRDELVGQLSAALAGRSADEWFEVLTAAGVPCGPINDLEAAFALAIELGLRPVAGDQVANPIKLGATPAGYRLDPPELGADLEWVREILRSPPAGG